MTGPISDTGDTLSKYRHPTCKTVISRAPIIAERVRRIDGQGFSFIPHRFLRDGFFASLDRDELSLYFLLVLASDRNGISFYRYDSICSLLQVPVETYLHARNRLIGKDLIAFDGTRFQVLSLPIQRVQPSYKPRVSHSDLDRHNPTTIGQILADVIDDKPRG
jgi:hypothetical protein